MLSRDIVKNLMIRKTPRDDRFHRRYLRPEFFDTNFVGVIKITEAEKRKLKAVKSRVIAIENIKSLIKYWYLKRKINFLLNKFKRKIWNFKILF